MKIFKNLKEFEESESELSLTNEVKKHIKETLAANDAEFAAEESTLVLLKRGEPLLDLFSEFPELEKVRPQNSSQVDNYLNEVFTTEKNGAGVSVYLPVEPPKRDGNEAVEEYREKYLEGGGPTI